MTSFFPTRSSNASVPTYATFASLPAGNQGDLAITLDTNTLYEYTGAVWGAIGVAGTTIIAVTDTSKIDLTNTAGTLSATVVAGSLANVDVSASAAIAGTKVSPSFGNQIVSTTNSTASTNATTGALVVTGGVGVGGAVNVAGNVTTTNGSSFISTGDISGVNITASTKLGQGNSFNANGGNFLTQTTNTGVWLSYGPQGGPGGWSTLKWDFATYDGGSSRTEMSLTRGLLTVTGGVTAAGVTDTGTTTLATGLGVLHSSAGGVVSSSLVVNADVSASAAIAVTKLATGTANQLLGTNAAGNANEFKTLSVGTSGTDFAIAHSAGGVAFNLPDAGASARGAVTTGTQTIAGAKTLSGVTTVSNATGATYAGAGALVTSGGAYVGESIFAGNLFYAKGSTVTANAAQGTFAYRNSNNTVQIGSFGDPGGSATYGSFAFISYNSAGTGITPLTITGTGSLTTDVVAVLGTKASTSSTVGALTVAGGVGVAGAVNAGSYIKTTNSILLAGSGTTAPSAGQGSLDSISPQLYIAQLGSTSGAAHNGVVNLTAYDSATANASNIVLGSGGVSMNNTTDSTSLSTGSLRLAGGLGVTKAVVCRAVAAIGAGSAGNSNGNHPYLACKLVLLTSGAVNTGVTVTHNITGANIVTYSASIDYTVSTDANWSGNTVGPFFTKGANAYLYYLNVNATHVSIEVDTLGTQVASRPVRVLIWYYA